MAGSRIGLSMTVKTCHEVVAYPIVRTAEQARSEALRLARASALASVPEGSKLWMRWQECQKSAKASTPKCW